MFTNKNGSDKNQNFGQKFAIFSCSELWSIHKLLADSPGSDNVHFLIFKLKVLLRYIVMYRCDWNYYSLHRKFRFGSFQYDSDMISDGPVDNRFVAVHGA